MRGGVRRANAGSSGSSVGGHCIYDFYSTEHYKTGRFFSPRYPQHYAPHSSCQFFFHALPHEKVKVTFDSVELEVTVGRSVMTLYVVTNALVCGEQRQRGAPRFSNQIRIFNVTRITVQGGPQKSKLLPGIIIKSY